MATTLFDFGRQGFLEGAIDWNTATIKVALLRGYTLSQAHEFMSDVTGAGATVVSTFTLTSPSVAAGYANGDPGTFLSVPTGAACSCYVIYQASAVGGGADVAASAQRLILFTDD